MSGEYQGDERKRTADDVSKRIRRHQNRDCEVVLGEVQGEPADCLVGVRHTGGVTLIQALLRNVGTCRPDEKGRAQVESLHEGASTKAGHGGGVTRRSCEWRESVRSEGVTSSGLQLRANQIGRSA